MAFVVTAVAAAIEVTTVASVLAAVSAMGLATSAVGLITGNKSLMQFGGELGLVGGLGGLAAGALGGAAAAGADVAEAGASSGASAADAGASGIADATTAANATTGAADGLAGGATTSSVAMPSTDVLDASTVASGAPTSMVAAPTPAWAGSASPVDPTSATAGTDIGTNSSGMFNVQSTPLADSAMPSAAPVPTGIPSVAPGSNSLYDTLKNGIDSTSTWFKSLKPEAQAEFIKSALAVPGGIQAQQNKASELAMTQQRINQSSYGSAVPTFGIINRAQKGTS